MSDDDAQKYRRLAERCSEELERATNPLAKAEWLRTALEAAKRAAQADKRIPK